MTLQSSGILEMANKLSTEFWRTSLCYEVGTIILSYLECEQKEDDCRFQNKQG